MITRIFRTSQPLHYFVFLLIVCGVYVVQRAGLLDSALQPHDYSVEILDFLALMGILFLVVFIITKNNLTENNSFAAAYFCFFVALIPEVISTHEVLVSNLFVMLAYRRIFSIRTGSNLKKKYLDATLWLCVSALFYPLAILFFIPLFITMIQFQSERLKHFLVVVFGVISVCLLAFLSHQLFGIALSWDRFTTLNIGFNFLLFNDLLLLTALALFTTLTLWAIFVLANKRISKSNSRFVFTTLLFMYITSIIVVLISSPKSPTLLLFVLFPLSVLSANISETHQSQWISDVVLTILIFLIVIRFTLNSLDIHFLY